MFFKTKFDEGNNCFYSSDNKKRVTEGVINFYNGSVQLSITECIDKKFEKFVG